MDFLRAELARKKALLEEREKKLANGKTYVKRSDIDKYETERYFERCTKRKKISSEEGKKEDPDEDIADAKDLKPLLEEAEVIKRLREREEPIRLFGESPSETYQRLRNLEMKEPSGSKSQTDFKSAMEKIDQEYLKSMMMELHGDKVERKELKVLSSIDEMKELCEGIADPDLDKDKLFGLVRQFYRWLFDVYEQTGEKKYRENEGDLTVKLERAKIKQAETYIRPLFRSLKKKTLDETLLRSFGEIGGAVLEKNYIGANDVYLRTAIGNAAWPIGVTMVGIHARTGREKLFAHNVAHVLNDEFQRKYLQAIKRLVTFAQRHFPTDPSKCVEFNA